MPVNVSFNQTQVQVGSASGSSGNTAMNAGLGQFTTLPAGYSDDHAGYVVHEGRHYYHLGNQHFVYAGTRDQLDQVLAAVTTSSGVNLDYLDLRDFRNREMGTSFFDFELNAIAGNSLLLTFKPSYLSKMNSLNDRYFGSLMPTVGNGSLVNFRDADFNFNVAEAGLRGQAERSALQGTAAYLYFMNYRAEGTVGINETVTGESALMSESINSQIPQTTLQLLQQVFPGEQQFNRGHLNILRAMGFINNAATAANMASWTLSQNGQSALTAMAANPTNVFVAANTLHAMTAEVLAIASEAKAQFDANGAYRANSNGDQTTFGVDDTKRLAVEIIASLNSLGNPRLPNNLDFQGRSVLALNILFNKPDTNPDFTANEINTAIAMGLIQVNPANNQVTLTASGTTFINTARPLNNTPPGGETNPSTLTPEQIRLRDFWNALYYFQNNGGARFADWVEHELDHDSADPTNGRHGGRGVEVLAGITPLDAWWDRGSHGLESFLRNMPLSQRQALIDAAKVISSPANSDLWSQVCQTTERGDAFKNSTVARGEVTEWLNRNFNRWMTDTVAAAKNAFTSPNFSIPSSFESNYRVPEMSAQTRQLLNEKCKELFGQYYAEMNDADRKKAIYLLTHVHQVFVFTPAQYRTVSSHSYAGSNSYQVRVREAQLYIKP